MKLLWKTASNEAITVENMSFEEMETAISYKAASESTTLLGDSQEVYNNLKAQYSSANDHSESMGVLQVMKNLLFDSILQNLASNLLKSFGFHEQVSLQLKMCARDRKLFFMDKTKVQSIQNRINKTMARTSAPSIDDDSKPTPEVAKLMSDGTNSKCIC